MTTVIRQLAQFFWASRLSIEFSIFKHFGNKVSQKGPIFLFSFSWENVAHIPSLVSGRRILFFLMDPVRLKRRHTSEREREGERDEGVVQIGAVECQGPGPPILLFGSFFLSFLFLLFVPFVPFTFSWLYIVSDEDIHLIFTFILLLLLLVVCLGYTRGKKPIDTR